jgi:hypothetical protein
MSKALTKQRRQMWERNPRCYWCGRETLFRDMSDGLPYTLEERDLFATVDHIRPRHHPDRGKRPEPGQVLRVLSCWRCNNDRDRDELKNKPTEWHLSRGGSVPLRLRPTEDLIRIAALIPFRPIDARRLALWARFRPKRAHTWSRYTRSQAAVVWELWERGVDYNTGDSRSVPTIPDNDYCSVEVSHTCDSIDRRSQVGAMYSPG